MYNVNLDDNQSGRNHPNLPRGAAEVKTPALKHVKDMSKTEYDASLKEVMSPKLKLALHTIAKHASKMDDAEYKKELKRLMDCFA